jgi:hypothetical protein
MVAPSNVADIISCQYKIQYMKTHVSNFKIIFKTY